MSRRLTVLVAAAIAAVAAGPVAGTVAALVDSAPAVGQAADAQGWWWQAQSATSPAPAPAPPYVDGDGLYVANSEGGGEAMSALRFTLPRGSTVGSLSLSVGDLAGTPIVGMCAADGDWKPVQNGAWEQRPAVDCAHPVPGKLSSDGATMTFDPASLVRSGTLDVAIVAGVDPSGAPLPFHVAFHKPGADALGLDATGAGTPDGAAGSTTNASAPDASGASATAATSSSGASGASGASATGSDPPTFPAAAGPLMSTAGTPSVTGAAPAFVPDPAVATAPAASGDAAATAAAGPGATRRILVPASSTERPDDRLRFASLIGLIGVATVYLRLSQHGGGDGGEPRPLITFGSGVLAPADDDEEVHP